MAVSGVLSRALLSMEELNFSFLYKTVTLMEIAASFFISMCSLLVLMKAVSQGFSGLLEQGGGCVSTSNCAGAIGFFDINSPSIMKRSQLPLPPSSLHLVTFCSDFCSQNQFVRQGKHFSHVLT